MDNTSLRDFDKGEGTYPKRKRSVKGKEPMDRGRSRTSQEEDEGQQASKHLRVTPQGQEKEVDAQPEFQAWLPAPMLHGEPLMDNTSLSDFNKGEGTYVADVLERSLLLPIDMANLKNLRRQELFLSMKRYLGMVRFLALAAFQVLVSWFLIYTLLISNGRLFKLPIEWRRWPMTRAGPWTLSVKSVWMPRRPLRISELSTLLPLSSRLTPAYHSTSQAAECSVIASLSGPVGDSREDLLLLSAHALVQCPNLVTATIALIALMMHVTKMHQRLMTNRMTSLLMVGL